MRVKTAALCFAMFLVGMCAYGQGPVIDSFGHNGQLSCTSLVPGSTCTVEWASSVTGPWTNSWDGLAGVVSDSNGTIQVGVPMFYRVRERGAIAPAVPSGMVLIPAGVNSGTDPDYGSYSLTVSMFYMDTTEVTKAQWDAVYSWAVLHGYSFSNAGQGKGANHPVHTVDWYDCVKWCNARSEKAGRSPCYRVSGSVYRSGESSPTCNTSASGYRLPTKDEWEYAARGGARSIRFPWGNTINHNYANYRANGSPYSYDTSSYTIYTYHPSYDSGGYPYTSPVGSFGANGYGLYDMAGNLWEWCNTTSGSYRSIRGGSWHRNATTLLCSYADWDYPNAETDYLGFRAVCR
jgi:sulfatase modifying factor 1